MQLGYIQIIIILFFTTLLAIYFVLKNPSKFITGHNSVLGFLISLIGVIDLVLAIFFKLNLSVNIMFSQLGIIITIYFIYKVYKR